MGTAYEGDLMAMSGMMSDERYLSTNLYRERSSKGVE